MSGLIENQEIKFGFGDLIIGTGDYYDRPAVFISREGHSGGVGTSVPKELEGDLHAIGDGDLVMTFPTEEQAVIVSDALCNYLQDKAEITRLLAVEVAAKEICKRNYWNVCNCEANCDENMQNAAINHDPECPVLVINPIEAK